MQNLVNVSVIQLTSTSDIQHNLNQLEHFMKIAKSQKAQLVITPENTGLMVENFEVLKEKAFDPQNHVLINQASKLAKELGLWVLIGSTPTKGQGEKVANRSFFLNDKGEVTATYDKIHLFDVDLPNGDRYRESERMTAGENAVVAQTPWGGLGLSICYDVRFPHLYRDLALAGASMMAIPAAFTVPTGQAHWEILVRSRAIETGSFVFASGQVGHHNEHRSTYGHSMIVDPWGTVLAKTDEEKPTVLTVSCDIAQSSQIRSRIPNLQHIRPYQVQN